MTIYTTKKESQALLKKVFFPGEDLPGFQDPGSYTKLKAEDCSQGQSSALLCTKELREELKKPGNSHRASLPAKLSSFPKEDNLEVHSYDISSHFSQQTCCDSYSYIYCSECGERRQVKAKCKKWRLCPYCSEVEGKRLLAKYSKMVKSVPRTWLRLLTLTVPNVPYLGKKDIQEIRSYWLKLLRLRRYKRSIVGGFYSIQLTNRGKGWHVHLHAICEVKHPNLLLGSLPGQRHTKSERKLSEDWYRLTKRKAKIVKISKVYSPSRGLNYLLKDMLKTPSLSGLLASEYLEALNSSRLLSTFGKWFAKVKELISNKWSNVECLICGNSVWITQYFLRDIEQELNFAKARAP